MRVLMVLTSHDQLGNTGRKTEGFRELVEDCLWGFRPDEGRRRFIVGFDVAGDLGFKFSGTDVNTPRRIFRRVMVEKKPSTAFSHEAEVSVSGRSGAGDRRAIS